MFIIEKGDTYKMKKLTSTEMKQINGGTTYKCTYCGFQSSSMMRMALHFGVKTWHALFGGEIVEV